MHVAGWTARRLSTQSSQPREEVTPEPPPRSCRPDATAECFRLAPASPDNVDAQSRAGIGCTLTTFTARGPGCADSGARCCGRFPAASSTQGRARRSPGPLSLAQRFPSRSERPASHTADVIPGHRAGTRQGGSGPHLRPETFTAHPKCPRDLLPGDSGQCTQRLPRLSGSHKQDQINSRAYFLLTPHVLGKGTLSQGRFYT